MNYARIYDEFVADRRAKEPEVYRGLGYGRRKARGSTASGVYMEHHHIRPTKVFGKNNRATNMISLTPEDHIFAHALLARMFTGRARVHMIKALGFMLSDATVSGRASAPILNRARRKHFAFYRKEYAQAQRERMRTPEGRASAAHARAHLTPEAQAKGAAALGEAGRNKTEAHQANITAALRERAANGLIGDSTRAFYQTPEGLADKAVKAAAWKAHNPMHDPDAKAKVSAAMVDYSSRPDVKARRSAAVAGDKNPAKRPEVRAKMSAAQKGRAPTRTSPVRCLTNGMVFDTITAAAKWAGLKGGSKITEVCRGRRASTGGHRWEYAD